MVDGIYQHYDAISSQNAKRRKPRQARSASEHLTGRLRRRSLRESPFVNPADSLFYANLPDKIKQRQFSREEQALLAGQLRASVILDAADEAIYKFGRRASQRQPVPKFPIERATITTRRSMETIRSGAVQSGAIHRPRRDLHLTDTASKRVSGVPESFYDSFRWADKEDDLDLRLFLDDYHANLREAIPVRSKDHQPSFRRHLSINKIPFSRQPDSPSRPATKDTTTPPSLLPSSGTAVCPPMPSPALSQSSAPSTFHTHMRRKSRAMSLITPKHAAHSSVSSIDPAAAHYQDPEARLKLRVYLASPQKFDEAIEFGFPSADAFSAPNSTCASTASGSPKNGRVSRRAEQDATCALRTFLDDDDDDRLDMDAASVPDPESPKTPSQMESFNPAVKQGPYRPYRVLGEPANGHRPSENYAQVPAASREMTLRMTLTRPDLRACEEHIYGWQKGGQHRHSPSEQMLAGRKSQSPLREDVLDSRDTMAMHMGQHGGRAKDGENAFVGLDHWSADASEKGVMKRFWNRVRRA